ncbi:hypothetical protein EX895_004904 [Sporisorium graminicola]|uniref:Zinc finger Mcm10/DnaG-type domain-containing protein n=1 Tax=Sporisorium graminicola TaxID=280036 RepID=A0A4V6ETP5_9BASI|nr:hypothetical protein EX895_004904 [Sporisorium graminicola]TKY86079.1 hypothetical protein EX895_004904 [Sporisorium graminicola]
MEVSSSASTSRQAPRPAPAPSHDNSRDRAPPTKRHRRPDIVAPSSPSKPKPRLQQRAAGSARLVDKEQEARREASLLSFAEARAKASSNYSAAQDDTNFHYPPGHPGDSSARGLLEQIKNRMHQRAPKHSTFLQKAKQVQQSLLDKQQRHAQLQKARNEAEKRESFRSAGFADQHAEPSRASSSQSQPQSKAAPATTQGVFSRAKERVDDAEDEEENSELEEGVDELEARHSSSPGSWSRDDDLAIVENLRPGPRAIPPNPEDPKWESMEPFSGHRLRERKLPHSQLKEHLRGRYHLPPSVLYSVARPMDGCIRSGERQVPVDGDWIVIATIVEKSELLVTRGFRTDAPGSQQKAPSRPNSTSANALDDDADPLLFRNASSDANGKLRLDLEPGNPDAFADPRNTTKRANRNATTIDDEHERMRQQTNLSNRSRKFVILKLVDLGVNSSSTDGSGSAGRGDNYLSLIAYESDPIDTSIMLRNNNIRSDLSESLSATASSSKKWINGSKGAFEMLYQQAEGTVIAVMNPKVMLPWAEGGVGSKESKMLRLTPRSAEDCLVIGQAADYKRCSAIKANGQRCGNFVDIKSRKQTRTSTCDFHLSRHMDELARGRPEFAANSTSRFGGGAGGAKPVAGHASSSAFPGRKTGTGYEDSAITNITTSYKSNNTNNPFARAALAKKLNSSYGNVADGMDNNGGAVYVSQSPLVSTAAAAALDADAHVRSSDPSSWKYDVSGRYGRGNTEKQSRLKRQIEEEQLMRKIEARFAPPSASPARTRREGGEEAVEEGRERRERRDKAEAKVLPVLPNGTAEMIHAAYSTLDQRKRVAAEKQAALDAKRRKYTGVVPASSSSATPSSAAEASKLQFLNLGPTKRTSLSANLLPITGLQSNTHTAEPRSGGDSRSKLLSLATGASSTPIATEPSLKIKRCHRPKLNLPTTETSESNFKVVGGELVHLNDFADDGWEDDLEHDHNRQSQQDQLKEQEGPQSSLSERIIQLHSQNSQNQDEDDDSDLEII